MVFAGCRGRLQSNGGRAVSYTHLDVYKRQEEVNPGDPDAEDDTAEPEGTEEARYDTSSFQKGRVLSLIHILRLQESLTAAVLLFPM